MTPTELRSLNNEELVAALIQASAAIAVGFFKQKLGLENPVLQRRDLLEEEILRRMSH